MPAPFKPVIRDELDVSNFAEEFTEMDPTYSPAALPQNCDRIFQVGGCSEMLMKHSFVMTHFCQTRTLLCGPCRSLHRTTFIFASALCGCLSWLWLQAVWHVDTDEKSHYTLSVFCLWLYLTYSTAIEVIKWSFQCPQKVAVSQHESVCVHSYSNWLKGLFIEVIAAICSSYWRNRCEWLFLM